MHNALHFGHLNSSNTLCLLVDCHELEELSIESKHGARLGPACSRRRAHYCATAQLGQGVQIYVSLKRVPTSVDNCKHGRDFKRRDCKYHMICEWSTWLGSKARRLRASAQAAPSSPRGIRSSAQTRRLAGSRPGAVHVIKPVSGLAKLYVFVLACLSTLPFAVVSLALSSSAVHRSNCGTAALRLLRHCYQDI